MEIWRKIQIANGIMAAIAIVLSVVAIYAPNIIYFAMWAWTLTLWLFMFLVPMPIIERNKKQYQAAMAVSFIVAIAVAVAANTWLQVSYPATHGFSRGMLVYSAAYVVVALVFAAWLKIKEKRNSR